MQVCTVGGQGACRRTSCKGGEEGRRGVRTSNGKDALPGSKDAILPRGVGSSDEEVDDHPITHVEAVLHCPVVGKGRGQGNLSKPSDGKCGLPLCKATITVPASFPQGTHSSPFKAAALLCNDRKPREKLYNFRSYTERGHEMGEPHHSQ